MNIDHEQGFRDTITCCRSNIKFGIARQSGFLPEQMFVFVSLGIQEAADLRVSLGKRPQRKRYVCP